MKKKTRLIPFALTPASWGLNGKSKLIAEAEYYYEGRDLDMRLAEINNEDPDKVELAKLNVKLKHEEISEAEFNKQTAIIKKEPYVSVIDMGVDEKNIAQGYFELDWNDEFVRMLQGAGLTGKNDEEIVNKWFNAVCRTVLLQEGADLDYGLQGRDKSDVIRKSTKEEKPDSTK